MGGIVRPWLGEASTQWDWKKCKLGELARYSSAVHSKLLTSTLKFCVTGIVQSKAVVTKIRLSKWDGIGKIRKSL